MGNTQEKSTIANIDQIMRSLGSAANDLDAQERAINRALGSLAELEQKIIAAGFRTEKVTEATQRCREVIDGTRRHVKGQREKQRAAEEARKAVEEARKNAEASNVTGRRRAVERALLDVQEKANKLESNWKKSFPGHLKNAHGNIPDEASDEFYDSDDMKNLMSRRKNLQKLATELEGASRDFSETEQLSRLGAAKFREALAEAENGRDPFPVSISAQLRQAVETLRSELKETPQSALDDALRKMLAAGLPDSVILRTPLPDASTRNPKETWVHHNGGVWKTDDALIQAEKVYGGDPLYPDIVNMIHASNGGGGHGARLRTNAPKIVLAANKAGFNLAQAQVRDFVESVGIACVSADSESDSGSVTREKHFRGEIIDDGSKPRA